MGIYLVSKLKLWDKIIFLISLLLLALGFKLYEFYGHKILNLMELKGISNKNIKCGAAAQFSSEL